MKEEKQKELKFYQKPETYLIVAVIGLATGIGFICGEKANGAAIERGLEKVFASTPELRTQMWDGINTCLSNKKK